MNDLAFLVAASLACYRVARLIILDSLFEAPRRWLHRQLDKRPGMVTAKLAELLGCPYCQTVWIAAAIVAAADLATDHPVPLPVFMWLAVASGALIAWRIIDPADEDDSTTIEVELIDHED